MSAQDRQTAHATCAHCDWTATLTGDDPIEMASFLRNLILLHVKEKHADLETFTVDHTAPGDPRLVREQWKKQ